MKREDLEALLKAIEDTHDSDAILGLRGLQNLFLAEGVSFSDALRFAAAGLPALKARRDQGKVIEAEVKKTSVPAAPQAALAARGMPDCRVLSPGRFEILIPGAAQPEPVTLPDGSAADAQDIALHLKDALVAAVINKSRFKLKLFDVKNGKGEIVETALQAEYDRDGMSPIRVWVGVKGEVAALATVLRKAVANCAPDFVAA